MIPFEFWNHLTSGEKWQIAQELIIAGTLTSITDLDNFTPTPEQIEWTQRQVTAKTRVQNIPGWPTWNETQAQDWYATNIEQPIATGRANLPATLTLATTRLAILALLDILDKMGVMLWAITRLLIALRDKNWPNL